MTDTTQWAPPTDGTEAPHYQPTPTPPRPKRWRISWIAGGITLLIVIALATAGSSSDTSDTQRVPVPASRVDDLPVFFVDSQNACLDRVVRVRIETGYDLTARYDGLTGRCAVIPTIR
jgi:hypothetical protein